MTQNGTYHQDNASRPGVVRMDQYHPTEVVARQTEHQANPNVGPATWSTAPKRKSKFCEVKDCTGLATNRWPGLCAGHGRWREKKNLDGDAG